MLDTRRESPIPRSAWIALTIIVVIGAILRLRGLNAESAWIDEVLSVIFSTGSAGAILEHLEPQHLPVYFWLNSILVRISADQGWLRSGSALLGIATLPMIFLTCATVGRVREGLCATFLGATSGFLIHYSQEIRMYVLVILLAMIGTWAVVSLSREPEIRHPVRRMAILLVVSLLNLYTSPFSVVLVAIHWGILALVAWPRPPLRLTFAVMAPVLAIAYLPAMFHMAPMIQGSADVVQYSANDYGNLGRLLRTTLLHFGGLVPAMVPLVAIGGLAGCVVAWRKCRPLVGISLLCFFVPLVGLYVAKPGHFFHPRYLSYAQPLILIMIAFTLVWIWDRTVGRSRTGPLPLRLDLYGAGLVGVAILVVLTLSTPDHELIGKKGDWRGLVRTLLTEFQDGDGVAIEPHYQDNTILYHLDETSEPGQRLRLSEDAGYSWYRLYRRNRLQARHPEEFGGPTVTLRGIQSLEDLADPRLNQESGRVWLVTAGDLPPRYEACFEPRFAMSPVRPYSEPGTTHRRLSVLYLGTNCPD
jgi:hypothetical protein